MDEKVNSIGEEMKFDTTIFQLEQGNLTVRRGLKWASIKKGEFLNDNDGVTYNKVLYTKIKRFIDITPKELKQEHDPLCRVKSNLLKVMKRIYPDFDQYELVTLVFFINYGY